MYKRLCSKCLYWFVSKLELSAHTSTYSLVRCQLKFHLAFMPLWAVTCYVVVICEVKLHLFFFTCFGCKLRTWHAIASLVVQIKLFDLRLIQKGPIQSYAGHINSHTHLPLVVDPSETLLMSGKSILGSRYHGFLSASVRTNGSQDYTFRYK